ncbi:VOC family protein [Streptomyces milbemycinicus]|uniref:VOC family protein n=1 Tax=Streptomyces milbemycinicus TaxID=476552 RepID=UPI0033FB7F84
MANPVYPPGTPVHIAYYLAVDNVDRRAETATANGACLVVPPFDVGDQGRMATLTDPVGAAFSLWQPRNFTGWKFPSQLSSAPHRMVLRSDQPEKARLFYDKTLGTPLTCADFIGTRGPSASVPQWELAVDVEDLDCVVAHHHGQDPVIRSEETGRRRVARLSSPEGLTFLVRCLQR